MKMCFVLFVVKMKICKAIILCTCLPYVFNIVFIEIWILKLLLIFCYVCCVLTSVLIKTIVYKYVVLQK